MSNLIELCWQDLCDKDDRTSPEEYPDMCLITRDELEGYLSEAVSVSSSEWQPIESAPRDGARILLICASASEPEARLGWFRDGMWWGVMPPAHKGPGGLTQWFPTHWMPLPLPPTEAGETSRER